MFGIRKKLWYTIALISAFIGIVILVLKICDVLPLEAWTEVIDKTTITLTSLIFMLFAFICYMKPSMKKIKVMTDLCSVYRDDLYKELTKNNKIPTEVYFFENDDQKLQTGNFVFQELSFEEALHVANQLMKDFVMIVYGELDEKKRKIEKAKIEFFNCEIQKQDGNIATLTLIRDYKFVK